MQIVKKCSIILLSWNKDHIARSDDIENISRWAPGPYFTIDLLGENEMMAAWSWILSSLSITMKLELLTYDKLKVKWLTAINKILVKVV